VLSFKMCQWYMGCMFTSDLMDLWMVMEQILGLIVGIVFINFKFTIFDDHWKECIGSLFFKMLQLRMSLSYFYEYMGWYQSSFILEIGKLYYVKGKKIVPCVCKMLWNFVIRCAIKGLLIDCLCINTTNWITSKILYWMIIVER